jgi:hypothetical protein
MWLVTIIGRGTHESSSYIFKLIMIIRKKIPCGLLLLLDVRMNPSLLTCIHFHHIHPVGKEEMNKRDEWKR